MIGIIVAIATALVFTICLTPIFIKFLEKKQFGQFIRQDGPTQHFVKRGTPTMGGVIIVAGTFFGYLVSIIVEKKTPGISAILVLWLMFGLGFVGFLDDYKKISKQNSAGLKPIYKILGQGLVGTIFAVFAIVRLPGRAELRPASLKISFLRDMPISLDFAGRFLGIILLIIWINFLVTAWSNAINLTDGLDGLATGTSALVFGAYVLVILWQINHLCGVNSAHTCYTVRDPRDLAMVCAAIAGACLGFLWWNASNAQIFMGDTGSLALGGTFAGVSVISRTELLSVLIGGLFVLEIVSVILQVGSFKLFKKRIFKMAPLHHHFELCSWQEVKIVVRFWLIALMFVAVAIGIFYGNWVVSQ